MSMSDMYSFLVFRSDRVLAFKYPKGNALGVTVLILIDEPNSSDRVVEHSPSQVETLGESQFSNTNSRGYSTACSHPTPGASSYRNLPIIY
jgi:hypothetical protein